MREYQGKFKYDQKTGQLIAVELATVTDIDENGEGALSYRINRTYTETGQPRKVALKGEGELNLDHTVRYQWNDLGQLSQVESPAGKFSYQYSKENPALLKQITTPAHTVGYNYEPGRNLITSVINRAHPENSSSQLLASNSSSPVISRYDYHNDNLGRRAKIAQTGRAFQKLKGLGENRVQVAYNDRSEVIGTKTLNGKPAKKKIRGRDSYQKEC